MYTIDRHYARQRGVSFIELIIFIVIIGIALAGILLVMNNTTRRSADPQVRKQALEIAESLLEEIEQAKFTYCTPSDTQAPFATTATVGPMGPRPVGSSTTNASGGCTSAATVENFAAVSGARPYGNVINYTSGLGAANATTYSTAAGTLTYAYNNVTSPAFAGNFTATVTINNGTALGGTSYPSSGNANVPGALLITVTVTYPQGTIVLDGYRTQYAPQLMP